jgi:PKD repeat protein
MKKLITLLFAVISTLSFAQSSYSRVKVFADALELKRLGDLGVTVDHGIFKEGTFFISDFSNLEIAIMNENNFDYEVLIEDVQAYYIEHMSDPSGYVPKNATCAGGAGGSSGFNPVTPTNFNQGTMGGYLKYNEMLAELDQMASLYPNLITAKSPISTFLSRENRPIYHVRMSDNPNTDESTETKVLYTAIHHAREPMSLMETIFFMWYMLENYNTNDEVKYILDNMQLYFVPCINVDGYLYNESTNPNGGGMWRKNRRNNGGGVYGVDLNRNYSYGWGTTGTSTNTSNETYCGTAAFSEPEVQAIRWLVQNNNFITAFNAHTYAEDLLFPIGTTTNEFAPHHDYFQAETSHMVEYNGYGAIKSSALYPASGDSDDYMYKMDIGVAEKDTVFAHTPEVGTAFWQPASEIVATCKDMMFPNLVLAHISRKYLVVKDADASSVATLTGSFSHSAQRLGRENGPVTVSIEPLLNVQSVGAPVVYNVPIMTTTSGAISYVLNPSIQFGDEIRYILKTDNGMWVKRDTIVKTYGALTVQILEDGNNANWTGTWGTTTSTFVSPTKSYTDSPTGNYGNNISSKTYTYVPTIDLTNASAAAITYYAKWNIEADYDYVQFQVSTNGGTTWIGQCGNYTVPGTNANGSVQPNNQPVYEGVQSNWVLEEISLSDYLGQVIKVRFKLGTDNGTTGDGFYFDDFKIMFNESGPVVAPSASFNTASTSVCMNSPVQFNDLSSNQPTTWAWNFGDNTTSTDQSPSHVYAAPGTYTVTLTVTNSAGTNTSTLTNYITVSALPTVTITSSAVNNVVCINDGTVQLNVSPANTIVAGVGVSGTTFDPTIAGLGSQTLTATFSDANGCVGTSTLTLSVEACASIDNLIYNGVKVLPNPNNGQFVITGLEIGEELKVYDMNGKVVLSQTILTSTQMIELDHVSSGLFYLQTVKNGKMGQLKFAVL